MVYEIKARELNISDLKILIIDLPFHFSINKTNRIVSTLALSQVFFSKITLEVYQHNTEDSEKILSGLLTFIPENHHKDLSNHLQVDRLLGYHKNEILRYSYTFNKKRQTREIATHILQQIQISHLLSDDGIKSRLTKKHELFIRINKQHLIKSQTFMLDRTSDVYLLKMKITIHGKPKDSDKLILSLITNTVNNHTSQ